MDEQENLMAYPEDWSPRTNLGLLVKEGRIENLDQIFEANALIREVEIVDVLLPDLKNEILDVNLVQKQTDAGESSRFQVTVAVGNEAGYVGVSKGKAKQIREAIGKAIKNAKLSIVPIRRGCGSWECFCNDPHSIPFKVEGKSGSVRMELLPAPNGVGLVAGDTAKIILRLAGIEDIWTRTKGNTRTSLSMAKATFNALKNTYSFKLPEEW